MTKIKENKEEVLNVTVSEHFNTSQIIRFLTGTGLTRTEIVKWFLINKNKNIRYQHVRNVQITPLTGKK